MIEVYMQSINTKYNDWPLFNPKPARREPFRQLSSARLTSALLHS